VAKLQIIGGGRMGEALLTGLISSGWADPADLRVVEPMAARRDELAGLHPDVDLASEPGDAEGTVLAVKPDVVTGACASLAGHAVGRVLSIAAGVPLAVVEDALPADNPVVRAMPNTPALIGAGAAAIAPGDHATAADLDWAEEVLGAVGTVVRVPESQLDAVTGLSGSGPAYVFLVAEALVEGGVLAGLPRDVAEQLAGQTLLGAARLVVEGEEHPALLRAAVTSPGGTTAAGVQALESAAVRAALVAAVAAATDRSRELGSS
jgi:pyrroline-5-carboxylate reductase